MSDLADLLKVAAPRESGIQGFWYGEFGRTITLVTDKAYVILPDIDPATLWGPCNWGPRVVPQTVNVAEGVESAHNIVIPLIVMPAKGDQCLAVFDNRRVLWVVSWWPS